MRLNADELDVLEGFYLHFAVPTDQLKRNPVVLGRIVASFNRMTGRDDSTAELLRYMINRRKNKKWPKLGDRAKKFESALGAIREVDGVGLLCAEYSRSGIPLDEYLFRPSLANDLARSFAQKVSTVFPAQTLVAALMALRKRGLLPRVAEEKTTRVAEPFADIHVVARKHRRRMAGQ